MIVKPTKYGSLTYYYIVQQSVILKKQKTIINQQKNSMKKFFTILIVTFFTFSIELFAQQVDVTGKVVDQKGEPIIGATAMVIGTTTGAISEANGSFSFKANVGQEFSVSFLGFTTQTFKVESGKHYIVTLAEDAITIDQVVVVGYGTQKKANLTGAVSQVNMDEVLGSRPVTTVGAALQGTIPGLTITGGAVPGTETTFNIRGYTSINGGGPLILVDNVPADINMINPEDIQSVTVLKDAASTAIYGARAAFGVILVTTKKANKSTKLQINYNNNIAFTKSINNPEYLSVEDFLNTQLDYDIDGKYHAQGQDIQKWLGYVRQNNAGTLMSDNPGSYYKDGRFVPKGESVYYHLLNQGINSSMFEKFGFQQTHNVSATGGSDKITYRMSLGYLDSDGPLVTSKDSYNRISVSSYVNADITNWMSTALDIRYSKDNRSYMDKDIYNAFQPDFQPIGKLPKSTDLDGEEIWMESPYANIMANEPTRFENENPRIYSRTSIRPVKGLEAVFEYTYDQSNFDKKSYNNPFEMMNAAQGSVGRSSDLFYRDEKRTKRYNSLNAYATYKISTKDQKHDFSLMAGFSQEQQYQEELWVKRLDMINPGMPSISGSTGTITSEDTFNEYAIRSGFFRFNYNYMNKYLVEANGRYDGSSRFPKENRFGFFPSFSLGWQLAKENFMEWSHNWLDELKLRASWGQVGNQNIGNYLYNPSMDSQQAGWITSDGTRPITLTPPSLVRANFTWEVVESLNLGVDFRFLNNRLQSTFEWYRRDTKGMLAPGMELPSTIGATAPFQNVADLRTKGWEFSAQWRDRVRDWEYSVGFNIFDSMTEITKYNNDGGVLADNSYYKGQKIGEIWGFITDGFYEIDDFEDTWRTGNWKIKDGITTIHNNNSIRPGDVKYVNLRDDNNSTNAISEGDNTLANPGDREIIGNNTARYQYGINASVGWKGINLSLLINGTGKRDAWLSGNLIWPMNYAVFGNVYANQTNYWQPNNWNKLYGELDYTAKNPDAFYPRIYDEGKNAGTNHRIQTKYLSDASYVRLKNVTLSYTIPRVVMQKIGLSQAKIFFSGENLYTWSKLPKGIDPVRLSFGYPFYATYSLGISLTL